MWLPPPLPRTLEAALRDLKSQKPTVRASAASDLARCVRVDESIRERAIFELVRALEDESPVVRHAAVQALADLEAKEATTQLMMLVEDDDPHVRQMALTALGEIRDPAALGRLRRALSDKRPDVRFQAVVAFTRISEDDDECADVLCDAMKDQDGEVRMIAVRAAEDRHREKPLPPRVLDAAAKLLAGTHDVANAAAILLCQADDARGDDRVAEIVLGKIPASKEDEQGAIEVAGLRKIEAVRPALEKRAWSLARHFRDTGSFHARIALALLGDKRAIAVLLSDLDSSRRATREAAVVACGRAHLVDARTRIEKMTDVDARLREEALRALENA